MQGCKILGISEIVILLNPVILLELKPNVLFSFPTRPSPSERSSKQCFTSNTSKMHGQL